MALEGDETELFGTSYQVRAITDQPQLETIFRWRAGNLLLQRGETACLHSAIRIDEYQHRPVGCLNSLIPGNRNPGVFLADYRDRLLPAQNSGRLSAVPTNLGILQEQANRCTPPR